MRWEHVLSEMDTQRLSALSASGAAGKAHLVKTDCICGLCGRLLLQIALGQLSLRELVDNTLYKVSCAV